jgi:hypothetical protein
MSDNTNAAAPAASEQDAIVQTQDGSEAAASDSGQLAAVVGDTSASEQGDGDDYAPWGENWRQDLTGGDEASLKLAQRYTSPRAVWQKLLAQEQVIRRGAHKAPTELPANATPEQIAEYRKAVGVPETPDGYEIKFAPELGAGETEQSLVKSFAQFAHEQNVPAQHTKKLFDWYQQELMRTRQEEQSTRQRQIARNDADLQKEWGADYSRNARILGEWMETHPSLAQAIKTYAHDKGVLAEAVELALELADPESLIGGEPGLGGKSMEDRIDELSGKYGKRTPAEEKEYDRLLEARIKRNEGGGRRNRAA